jgi:hypothetical protein
MEMIHDLGQLGSEAFNVGLVNIKASKIGHLGHIGSRNRTGGGTHAL